MGGLLIPDLYKSRIIPPECIHLETWRFRHLGKIHPLRTASLQESLIVTPPIAAYEILQTRFALTPKVLTLVFVLRSASYRVRFD